MGVLNPVRAVLRRRRRLVPRSAGAYILVMTKLTVWYDADCPLCRREIAFMRRLDRRSAIVFVPVAEAGGACPIEPSALLAAFHAEEDGRIVKGAAAFAAMWRAIPVLRPLGLAARAPVVLNVLEAFYRAFLLLRPRLQGAVRRLEGGTRPA